jgi:hypothetical protein
LTSGGNLALGRPFMTLIGCDMAMVAAQTNSKNEKGENGRL